MDLLVISINAVVVAAVGAIVAWFGKGRFEAIDHRIDRLETRLDGRIEGLEERVGGRFERLETRFDGFEARTDRRFDTLQSSVDAMRSDITQVALAVGVRPRAQNS